MFFGIFVLNRVSILSYFINFALKKGIFSWTINSLRRCAPMLSIGIAYMFNECLKQVIKNWNSVLNRVGKSLIFVSVNRERG